MPVVTRSRAKGNEPEPKSRVTVPVPAAKGKAAAEANLTRPRRGKAVTSTLTKSQTVKPETTNTKSKAGKPETTKTRSKAGIGDTTGDKSKAGKGEAAESKPKTGQVAQTERHETTKVQNKREAPAERKQAKEPEFKLPPPPEPKPPSLLRPPVPPQSSRAANATNALKVPRTAPPPSSTHSKMKVRLPEVPSTSRGLVGSRVLPGSGNSKPGRLPVAPKPKHKAEIAKSATPAAETVVDPVELERIRTNDQRFAQKIKGVWRQKAVAIVNETSQLIQKKTKEAEADTDPQNETPETQKLINQNPMLKEAIDNVLLLSEKRKERLWRHKDLLKPFRRTPLRVSLLMRRNGEGMGAEVAGGSKQQKMQGMKRDLSPGSECDSPIQPKLVATGFNFRNKNIKQPTKKLREDDFVVPAPPPPVSQAPAPTAVPLRVSAGPHEAPVAPVFQAVAPPPPQAAAAPPPQAAAAPPPQAPAAPLLELPVDLDDPAGPVPQIPPHPEVPASAVLEVTPTRNKPPATAQRLFNATFVREDSPELDESMGWEAGAVHQEARQLNTVASPNDTDIESETDDSPDVVHEYSQPVHFPQRVPVIPAQASSSALNATYEILPIAEEEDQQVETNGTERADTEMMPPPATPRPRKSSWLSKYLSHWAEAAEDYDITMIDDYEGNLQHREDKLVPDWALDTHHLHLASARYYTTLRERTRKFIVPKSSTYRKFHKPTVRPQRLEFLKKEKEKQKLAYANFKKQL